MKKKIIDAILNGSMAVILAIIITTMMYMIIFLVIAILN